MPGGDRAVSRLAWVGREGDVEWLDAPARVHGVVDLSPSGERIAAHVLDVKDYLWIYDIGRREGRRVSGDDNEGWPVWAPDGRSLAFKSYRRNGWKLMVRGVDGDVSPKEIATAQSLRVAVGFPGSWSPDGRAISLFVGWDRLAWVSAEGARQSVESPGAGLLEFLLDGRWVAYSQIRSGRSEVWVASFPDLKVNRQVSVDGGIEAAWCPCGELFYRNGNRWLATRMSSQPDLRWDPPRELFSVQGFVDTPGRSYDVSPDGKRILVAKSAATDEKLKIHLVSNWLEALTRRDATAEGGR